MNMNLNKLSKADYEERLRERKIIRRSLVCLDCIKKIKIWKQWKKENMGSE